MKRISRHQLEIYALMDAIAWRESYLDAISGCKDMKDVQDRTTCMIVAYKDELERRGIRTADPFSGSKTVSLDELRKGSNNDGSMDQA